MAVVANQQTEDWTTLPWEQFQRNVYRLQQRIYRAARCGDQKRVHNLQRLLLHSWSSRCLAVRRVTQDNRGKNTPGVDGVASLTPKRRMHLAKMLRNLSDWTTTPLRRVYVPKFGKTAKHPLSIPTMSDRAMRALVKLALEPELATRRKLARPGTNITVRRTLCRAELTLKKTSVSLMH